MDPFNRLAPELRTMILCDLPTRSEVISASHASPALFQQRIQSHVAILKPFIRKDLPGDLLQDAIAIVTFPKKDDLANDEQIELVHDHLTQWGRKALPNPLNENYPDVLLAIDSLVIRLNLFMEDYINKATSSYLPRAYASLPAWSHASLSERLKRLYESKDGFRLHDLHTEERLRLMRAFLRYELMCKLNPLRPSAQAKVWRDTKDWVWDELENYENFDTDLNSMDIGEPSGPEMLQCVHEYLRTLYGAIISRIVTPQGTDIDLHVSSYPISADDDRQRGLVFPDHLQFNPEMYMENQDPQSFFGIRHSYIDRLAGCGFDLIMSLLTSEMSSCSRFLECFYSEVTCQHPGRAPFGCRLNHLRYYPHTILRLSDDGSGLWRRLMPDFYSVRRDDSLSHAFRRMYRQRAWAFFDDDDLYHNGYALPAIEEFIKDELRLQSKRGNTRTARFRGRGFVQTMRMDMFESPSRKLLKNGAKDYPALMDKVKVAFWKRDLINCPRL